MIAGFCMSLVSSPIDVVKTRIMNSRDSAGAKSYSGMFDCLYKVELPMPLIYLLCHQQQDAHTLNRRLERKDCWDYIRDLCRHSCDWVHISLSLSLSLSLSHTHTYTHTHIYHLYQQGRIPSWHSLFTRLYEIGQE